MRNFANVALGSKLAVVFVDGVEGNKCLAYSGTGKLVLDWCKTSYHFVCEFIDKGY